MRNSEFSVKWGTRLDLDHLAEQLVNLGYERTPLVENFGQFSIRGGILDIAPFHLPHPVRIEFFGDEVDSLRSFDFASQRSLENLEEVVIKPARETLYDLGKLGQIKDAIWEAAQRQSERLHRLKLMDEADELLARTARHLEAFDQQRYFPGMDQYKVFFGPVASLLDSLPADTLLVLDDPVRIKEAAISASWTSASISASCSSGGASSQPAGSLLGLELPVEKSSSTGRYICRYWVSASPAWRPSPAPHWACACPSILQGRLRACCAASSSCGGTTTAP